VFKIITQPSRSRDPDKIMPGVNKHRSPDPGLQHFMLPVPVKIQNKNFRFLDFYAIPVCYRYLFLGLVSFRKIRLAPKTLVWLTYICISLQLGCCKSDKFVYQACACKLRPCRALPLQEVEQEQGGG
jgi:hypothetical protein